MNVIRLYTGNDGESHIEDMEVPFVSIPEGHHSEPQKAKSVMFLELKNYFDYHNAPQRQYVIFLDGDMEIEVHDGSRRIIRAGEVLLAEDTEGRGHITRSVDGAARKAVFIVLD